MLQKSALVIRFSSFGDIVQSSFVAQSLKQNGFKRVDLFTKSEFSKAFSSEFLFDDVLSFEKSKGLRGLFDFARIINQKNYDLIYDAHNNQRTFLLKFCLLLLNPLNLFKFKTRSKNRLKRFFLFQLKVNLFPKPFKGAESFLKPLGLKVYPFKLQSLNKEKTQILLAPSAAWDLKKWPKAHWISLAQSLLKQGQEVSFIGGPQDHFIKSLAQSAEGSKDLSGKLSWSETITLIKEAKLLISGDTGVLHIADYFAVPAIGLMGPSAFGTPSRDSSFVISKNLKCQPCSKDGRGRCKNSTFKKCLVDIHPKDVLEKVT